MTMTTQAAVMWAPGQEWEVVELALDAPRHREVLVRFEAAGLCRSDHHVQAGDWPVPGPMVGGHEGAGVVEKVGFGVTRVRPGDRIVCSFVPACGTCRWCATGNQNVCVEGRNAGTGAMLDDTYRFHSDGRDVGGICALGTFSRRAVISENSCVPLPDDIPFDVGALLACGVPTGWGAAVYAAGVRAGTTVVIYGAGGVGINAVQGAAYAGAQQVVVVDPVPFKREQAKDFGATHAFASHALAMEHVRESTCGELAENAIITVGLYGPEEVERAVSIVGKRGTVTVVSTGKSGRQNVVLDGGSLMYYRHRIQGTLFGDANPTFDIPNLIRLYRSGHLKLDELITRRYRLDQVNDAFEDMLAGVNLRGVIVHADQQPEVDARPRIDSPVS